MLPRLLFATLIAMWMAYPAFAERRVALVVGNGDYKNATKLNNPVNDARDMKARLERLSFEVVSLYDATVDDFDAAIATFEQKVQGADLALFFYAGHALQFGGINYLMPIDVKLDNDSALERRAVVAQKIISKMERAAKVNLVFLDACRNNTLLRDLSASMPAATRDAGDARGLARMDVKAPNTLIVFATAPNEVAADGTGTRNSPFTAALLRHIETAGISVQDMLTSVVGDVLAATRGVQKPELLSRLGVKVVLRDLVPIAAVPTPAVIPSPAPAASREREASVAWELAKASCNSTELEAFRTLYADTYPGALAKTRLAEIEAGKICAVPKPATAAASVMPPLAVPPPAEAPAKSATPTDNEDFVRQLQTELRRAGCFDSNADGKWGPLSVEALSAYRRLRKVPVSETGPTAETLAALKAGPRQVCPITCDQDEVLRDGKCVAKEKPEAQKVAPPARPQTRQPERPPAPSKVSCQQWLNCARGKNPGACGPSLC